MNIQKQLITLLFITVSSIALAQETKNQIQADFTNYLNSIVNMELEKSLDYMPTEFFDIIPKAKMLEVMKQTFNNPDMEIDIKNPTILKIDDAQKIENKYYSLLTYSSQMDMKINGEEHETEEDKKLRISMTKTAFQQSFGAENVVYNDTTGFFEIQSQKDVYGISDNGKTGWKFLVLEKNQKVILEKLLPAQLIQDL
ncbi:hypothetical protein LY01_01419 [Nonlabens xylanidelens]|uniref:Uncharacterized protein n=1 Tax=Nonlabens xylanidelens TaxID=191564 RepID=A0A2S6IP12_9FLAO|nr:hypothetical protein [Nonlabens xylanidelens]PPK95826.1 hypothetical protein LY01_01419 [Nonlabens xylanidelens]PQJ22609.1 hypothetical protein BST94_03300 [Nonlabens xylanidelens]